MPIGSPETRNPPTHREAIPPAAQRQILRNNRGNNEKSLFSWKSPERMWKPHSRTWYLSYALLVLVLIFIAVRMQYYIIVLGLIAFLFLWFVQAMVEPLVIRHKVTKHGILTQNRLFRWKEISWFWFSRKDGQLLLHIDPVAELRSPRVTMLINDRDDARLFEILLPHLKYGSGEDVGLSLIAPLIHGEYIQVSHYLGDLDQPEPANGNNSEDESEDNVEDDAKESQPASTESPEN